MGMLRVLLIDDDDRVLKAYGRFLSYANLVTTATTCEEALRIIRETPEKAEIIVSDFCMPDMESGEFFTSMRSLSRAPIIVITGFASHPELKKLHAADIQVLEKPVRLNLLQQLIQQTAQAATKQSP